MNALEAIRRRRSIREFTGDLLQRADEDPRPRGGADLIAASRLQRPGGQLLTTR